MQSQPHTHSLHNDSEVGDSTIPCTRRQNLNITDIQHWSQKELSSKQTLDFGINKGNGDGSAGMLSHAHLKFLQSSGTRILCRRLAGDCFSRIRNTVAGKACCAPPPAPAPLPPTEPYVAWLGSRDAKYSWLVVWTSTWAWTGWCKKGLASLAPRVHWNHLFSRRPDCGCAPRAFVQSPISVGA